MNIFYVAFVISKPISIFIEEKLTTNQIAIRNAFLLNIIDKKICETKLRDQKSKSWKLLGKPS